jgi:hypothetical protein
MAYHVIERQRHYEELGADYMLRREDSEAYRGRLVRQLERMVLGVSLEPAA